VTPCSLLDVSEKPAASIFSLVIDELDATVLYHWLSRKTHFPTPIVESAGCFKIPELIYQTTRSYIPGNSKFLSLICFEMPVRNCPRTKVTVNGVRPRVLVRRSQVQMPARRPDILAEVFTWSSWALQVKFTAKLLYIKPRSLSSRSCPCVTHWSYHSVVIIVIVIIIVVVVVVVEFSPTVL
jgi:hypothetical protein